jgi:hypothetical protein
LLVKNGIGVLLRVILVDKRVAGFDRQFALARHGVLGVHHKVEDRGLHLPGVDLDLPEVGAAYDFEIDIFTHRPPEKIRHSGEQLIDVGQPGIERLPAREGEQPLRQHRRTLRPVRGIGDHAGQKFPRCIAPGLQAGLRDFEVAADDREQIVEVMRDTAGQLPHRFHFLALPEHVLGFAAVYALLRQCGLGLA